ncbi:MAG: hypothetical protein Q9168_007199 [Polycauliona sp. 1 TL-2023]
MADLTYFTCTLGQAVQENRKWPHQFGTVTEFIDHQAQLSARAAAVAFPLPSKKEGIEWDLAKESTDSVAHSFETIPIPKHLVRMVAGDHSSKQGKFPPDGQSPPEIQQQIASDVAFLFHTSGTSTGLPKPISQTHYGAVGVLPCLPHGHRNATFTTTPLYHGGIADCFRAWTSGALIWLFPGKDEPITASNIFKSLDCARQAEVVHKAAPVRYFSSVPYVLRMVSAEPEGMKMLQSMEIVGVGGAALPPDIGDSLVHGGVNLVSRFGSAECGFLLSSHRDYEKDKEWQYLRSHDLTLLAFEEQQDGSGLSELIIRPNWPYMAKRNREDGSLATADLFVPHPSIKNAWKYHSRADSQLTLVTGKKFDPAPLEAAIASHELLNDAMIFGNGMQSAGALLFRSEESETMDKERLLNEVWPSINRLNKEGQAHTRLSKAMLIVMDPEAPHLEKSSKGTILRAQAEKTFEKEIQATYDQSIAVDEDGAGVDVPDDEIPTAVLGIIKTVLGTDDRIPGDADFFSFGVDSVACMAIRAKLQSRILDPKAQALPLNVVYDCGNIERLSKYLVGLRNGQGIDTEDEIQLMKDLVSQYSDFSAPSNSAQQFNENEEESQVSHNEAPESHREHILLTGATGALGAHILHLLRSNPSISTITCLVRASSPHAAHERVSKSLSARGKPGLPPFSPSPTTTHPPIPTTTESATTAEPTVTCLPCTLSDPSLGLPPQQYAQLARTTNVIIHAAWAVNFTARLRSFEKDHIAGLSHLLHLGTSSTRTTLPIRFLFLSSTASVTNTPTSAYPIAERISTNPEETSPLGYSRSKWVAEGICNAFFHHRSLDLDTNKEDEKKNEKKTKKADIAILRIGQLTSDTVTGIWNTSEAYPLILSTAPVLHALPDLGTEVLDWMPVDVAARAVVEAVGSMGVNHSTQNQPDTAFQELPIDDERGTATAKGKDCPVFHILNPSPKPHWTDLLAYITSASPSLDIQILPPREWLAKLEAYEGDLPAKKLVGLWRGAFGVGADEIPDYQGGGDVDGKGGASAGQGEDGESSRDGVEAGKEAEGGEEKEKPAMVFETSKARSMSHAMCDIKPLDREFLIRMWRWVEGVAKQNSM